MVLRIIVVWFPSLSLSVTKLYFDRFTSVSQVTSLLFEFHLCENSILSPIVIGKLCGFFNILSEVCPFVVQDCARKEFDNLLRVNFDLDRTHTEVYSY